MILSCNNISKSFGENVILSNCSFNIEDKEKTAIVGINGVGKTTLLRIIVGEIKADIGSVSLSSGKTMGYLAQMQDISSDKTVYEEVLEARKDIIKLEEKIRELEEKMKSLSGDELENALKAYNNATSKFELENGFSYKSEIIGVLKGLGFAEDRFDMKVTSLSGGQKTRLALAKLLVSKPDIILLDEPINHLDLNSIAWLETYLSNYFGAVIIVAHDRYFLDHVVEKVVEIDRGNTCTYKGNYSDYSKKKAMKIDAEIKAYLNNQREIKHEEKVIEKLKSFNREKSIKRAESREKKLEKTKVLDKPLTENAKMSLRLEPEIISGNDVLSVKNLAKSFGDNLLFDNISFEIKRGEKLAIIGNNGTGKSTILKIINSTLNADEGNIKLGSNVNVGYYDQELNILNPEKTIFDEIHDAYPNLKESRLRTVLAAFLFKEDDVFKKISSLSGGEKGRVSLAKLMLSKSNFLILDEPTNHLDIMSKEILENAINNYDGTVLYVSHDRFFINKTADRILELDNKSFTSYLGNYDYYLEKKEQNMQNPGASKIDSYGNSKSGANSALSMDLKSETETKLDWKQQKEEQARKRKKENDLKKLEEKIEELESKKDELNKELIKPEYSSDAAKLTQISNEINTLEEELSALYEKWDEIA